MEEIKDTEIRKQEPKVLEKRKVLVNGVGYENPDGSGTQTTYKVDYEVTLVAEEKGAEYPYLVEYRGNRRYFKDIKEK